MPHRLDINREMKPFTPIKPPPDLHPAMLYIPSIIARLEAFMDDLIRTYERDRKEVAEEYQHTMAYLADQFAKDLQDLQRQLGPS